MLFLFAGAKLGLLLTAILGLSVAIALPAMIIILVVNQDIGQALNPLLVFGLITRIGWRYLLLLCFLLLLFGAPATLGYALIRHLPSELQMFVWVAVNNFYLLVTYHLLGYVILQYHERVNFPVEYEALINAMYPEIGVPSIVDPKQADGGSSSAQNESGRLLNEIGALVQEGKIPAAIELVRPHAASIDDLTLSQRYVDLLEMAKNTDLLLAHIPRHLSLLLCAGEKQKAIKHYLFANTHKLDLKLEPQELFRMAGWLNEKGQAKAAIQAFSRFIKAHPSDALVPKAYYLVAQIFHERLMNPEKAKGALRGLIRKFPDHEMAGFAQSYIGRL